MNFNTENAYREQFRDTSQVMKEHSFVCLWEHISSPEIDLKGPKKSRKTPNRIADPVRIQARTCGIRRNF